MHPQSTYDAVVLEHRRQEAERARAHLVIRRRRARRVVAPTAPKPRRDRRTGPAAR